MLIKSQSIDAELYMSAYYDNRILKSVVFHVSYTCRRTTMIFGTMKNGLLIST